MKQKKFCKLYASGHTASESAYLAGYSWGRYGSELLRHPGIQQHLREILQNNADKQKRPNLQAQIARYNELAEKAMFHHQFAAAIRALQRVDALLRLDREILDMEDDAITVTPENPQRDMLLLPPAPLSNPPQSEENG